MSDCLAIAKDVATIVSAPVAAGAFAFTVWKQRQDVALGRELDAKRRWTEFMDMAFKYPESAYKPDYVGWKNRPEKSRGERPKEDIEHKNFVSRFLFTAEEILDLVGENEEWVGSIKSQMDCHKKYFLDEMRPEQIACYSKPLQHVISAWKSERAVKQASGGGNA